MPTILSYVLAVSQGTLETDQHSAAVGDRRRRRRSRAQQAERRERRRETASGQGGAGDERGWQSGRERIAVSSSSQRRPACQRRGWRQKGARWTVALSGRKDALIECLNCCSRVRVARLRTSAANGQLPLADTDSRSHSPSRFMFTAKHFCRRQNWHWLRRATSTTQLPFSLQV